MIDETDFEGLAADIAALNGIPIDLALKYAYLIGDTIERDEESGLIVVRDRDDRELARVRLPSPTSNETAEGAPPIPASVPPEQIPFSDVELYDPRTGAAIGVAPEPAEDGLAASSLAQGAPRFPKIPREQIPFVRTRMRTVPPPTPGMEADVECYDVRTGETIPECPEQAPLAPREET